MQDISVCHRNRRQRRMDSYGAFFIVTIIVFVDIRGSEADQNICANASDMFQGSGGGDLSNRNQTDFGTDLPPGWSAYCKTKRLTWMDNRYHLLDVSCVINHNDPLLRFKDFQYWGKDKNFTKYKLRLTCSPGGVVSLPWPMRAHHLVHVEVRNCNIVDHYMDSINETIASIPDELEVSIIDSCVTELDICHFEDFVDYYDNFTRDFYCGPEGVRKYVFSNVSSILTGNTLPWIDYLEYIKRVAFKYYTVFIIPRYTNCVFENLEIRDDSVDSDRSAYQLQTLVAGKKFPHLKLYNISHTGIRQIKRELQDWQLYFPKLEYLDLSWNAIQTFSFVDHLPGVDKPLMVNLQRNNITAMNNSTLRMLMKLKSTKVDIRDNPFICDCKMLYFWDFVNSNTRALDEDHKHYRYFYNLTCGSPANLHGWRISSLGRYDLCPDNETDMILTISLLSVVVCMLIFVIIVAIRYRHEVVILCYTRLNIVLSCRFSDPYETKSYDAFIAHSNEDTRWVITELASRLENPKTGKALALCLPDRDFDLGAATTENIVKSVKNSRHTVLVISKNFLENEWCLLEFRSAFRQCFLDKKHHLIIVMLEKVQLDDLDRDLKLCLKTFTRITVGHKLFWDRLVFVLADRYKRKTLPAKYPSSDSDKSNSLTV